MTIQIAGRLKPFSHQLGTWCLIPSTTVQVQAFPTLLRFKNLATEESWEEKLEWKGPVNGFTIELDLEKGIVIIFGQTAEGFRRLWIEATPDGIQVTWDKEKKEKTFPLKVMKRSACLEKLSLGKHTKLDWSLILRKMNVEDMAPVLFLLGQQVPEAHAFSPILSFLSFTDKVAVAHQLKLFFRVGFHGLLVPRLKDEEFQGIIDEGQTEGSPLALLVRGYEALRALFFQEEKEGFSFLPFLPPEFHAGRIIQLQSKEGDLISLEWSKKLLKRAIIRPAVSREISFYLQKPLCSYRVNKRARWDIKKPLQLEAGKVIFLDRFEK